MMDEWIIYLSFALTVSLATFVGWRVHILRGSSDENFVAQAEDHEKDFLRKKNQEKFKQSEISGEAKSAKEKPFAGEIFDYKGTRIFHIDGTYTVIDGGVSRNYYGHERLPALYRRMILELDGHAMKEKNSYFLEQKEGKYLVRFPDGSKKKYSSYKAIPEDVKIAMNG